MMNNLVPGRSAWRVLVMSIPKLIAVGLAAAATLAALLFLAWPAAVMGQSELALSDFDQDGLEVEALALFVAGDAGSEPALYNVSSRWDASGEVAGRGDRH